MPTKENSAGLQQPYDPANGEYSQGGGSSASKGQAGGNIGSCRQDFFLEIPELDNGTDSDVETAFCLRSGIDGSLDDLQGVWRHLHRPDTGVAIDRRELAVLGVKIEQAANPLHLLIGGGAGFARFIGGRTDYGDGYQGVEGRSGFFEELPVGNSGHPPVKSPQDDTENHDDDDLPRDLRHGAVLTIHWAAPAKKPRQPVSSWLLIENIGG